MGRQKRNAEKPKPERNHPQANRNQPPPQPRTSYSLTSVKGGITILCLVVAVAISFKGYLETRVNSRFDKEKMVDRQGLEIPGRYWGSYRPGSYFGMKTRDQYSLVAGMMWYFPMMLGPEGAGVRHWCEQGDNLDRYTWTEHDGRNFGVQEIQDGPYTLETSFVKRLGGNYGGDWTARVTVTVKNQSYPNEVALIFYAALDEKTEGWIGSNKMSEETDPGIVGKTSGLGRFKFSIRQESGRVLDKSFLSTVAPGLHVLKETLVSNMRVLMDRTTDRSRFLLPGEVLHTADDKKADPNFVAVQVLAKVPVVVDFVFESESFFDRPNSLVGENFKSTLDGYRSEFHKKFENIYKLRKKRYDQDQIAFAKAVLSNLIGGIGYFYGSSRVQSAHTKTPVPYWKAPLYTAVPSRSFFPRGFLWDEGFHGLVISTWDLDIELDIIKHWFDLMNVEGWIPREQILGQEALAKVPEEFVTQHNTNANPPAFFLTINFILKNYGEELSLSFLDTLYTRLQAWYDWFNVTQVGNLPGTYRWRGRDPSTMKELNPKTLTSGLDDYPRASHPTDQERHLDLRCWIALASSTLEQCSRILARGDLDYALTYDHLVDPVKLKKLHWSEKMKRFADYGLHTDSVILKKPSPVHSHSGRSQSQEKVRVVLSEPTYRLIDSSFGYISLFPFLLQQLDKDSPELGYVLKDLEDPELLWTNYGLRSLSKNSPFYMKHNTEHDPPYWRGAIWININYLAVKALDYYAKEEGPYSEKASELYQKLRKNLINNMYNEYKRTGYVWEQYNDETGHGQGSRPFTGWSSLVLLLMSEIY